MDSEKTKITTKTYFACGECKEKMESLSLASSSDLFSAFSSSKTAMFCNKKECSKFGYLTVAGIKIEE